MYVCICHALKGRDVETAKGSGAGSPADIHKHFGVKVQCGRCVPTMRQMLRDKPVEPTR